jgi:type IV secretion system protein TrbB
MVGTERHKETASRGARMLRTALGPAIASFLQDASVVEVMLNPDGRLWIDRLKGGLEDTGVEGPGAPSKTAPSERQRFISMPC